MRALVLIVAIFICASVQQRPDNLQKHTLSLAGINASFIGYGARLTNLFVFDKQGKSRDVVLGYDQGSGYIHDTEHEHTYFGAVGAYLLLLSEEANQAYERRQLLIHDI